MGKDIQLEEMKDLITDYYDHIKEGDKIVLEIFRPKFRKGKYKPVTLVAVAKK